MSCPRAPEDLPYSSTEEVVDLLSIHPFTPKHRHQPRTRGELVAAVEQSTQGERELRALGSVWSLSSTAVAADVVDTFYLRQHLGQPYGGAAPLDAARFRPGFDDLLNRFCAQHADEVSGRHFVHVEAGIKICQLLDDLKASGLGLPTMGAGGGQSLAGALSTGTHGADFAVPPLIEWIRAIHLVGPLGREWWVTPEKSIFTGDVVMTMAGWPETGLIVANDEAFNAVRVAVGRMGVIYSMILEVVEPYTLVEVSHQGGSFPSQVQKLTHVGEVFAHGQIFTNPGQDRNSWPRVRDQLAVSGVVDGHPTGLFSTSIDDVERGWLREEVIGPTADAVAAAFEAMRRAERSNSPWLSLSLLDPVALALATEFYAMLTPEARVQLDVQALFGASTRAALEENGLIEFVVKNMGLSQLAQDLRGAPSTPLRHLNIAVSLASTNVCWVTRRWAVPATVGAANLEHPPLSEVTQTLRDHRLEPSRILTLVARQIMESALATVRRSVDEANLFLPGLGGATVNQYAQLSLDRLVEFIGREMPRVVGETERVNGTAGEALFLFLYRAATDPAVSDLLKGAILTQVTQVIGSGAVVNPARVGDSTDILDVHGYEVDYAASGDSAEFFFDASERRYLAFADAVVQLAGTHEPVFGYMGIRFTPRSSASIAMQRFALTASVEVATGRARTDPMYAGFWSDLHDAAIAHGGIPHWGQEFRQSAADLSGHYGKDLTLWRSMLAELSVDGPAAFSTPFTRDLGLEPGEASGVFIYDALTAFLTALDGSSDS